MKINVNAQKEDVLTKAVLKPSIKKKIDAEYWETQEKIKREIFE